MGQCVLKDCGFEYQKMTVNKGESFAEFFKQKLKSKAKIPSPSTREKMAQNESQKSPINFEKCIADTKETTKIHPPFHRHSRAINVVDDMIIDINHSKAGHYGLGLSTPPKQFVVQKPQRKISDMGAKQYRKPKVRRLLPKEKRQHSPHFTPLLDSLRDSLEKSPFQSKISFNEKYEKTSLFRAAQNNFQTNNEAESSEDGSEKYENIFSDADSSVGWHRGPKTSGFFNNPKTDNIINVKSHGENG